MLLLDDELIRELHAGIRARYRFDARIDHLALFGRCETCLQREEGVPARDIALRS
jgi:hypothetical protein